MNAALLLEHYAQIADAPDAIARLRRFILDLAVRGKLVEQDPNDEPASELLKRIAAERARLVKVGEAQKGKDLSPAAEDAEFDLPQSWNWARLGSITSYIQRGKSPTYAEIDGLPVVSQKCVQWSGLNLGAARLITRQSLEKYEKIRFLQDGDLLWNSTGTGTIGRIIRIENVPDNLVCDSHVTVVRCLCVLSEYIRIWLRSDHVYGVIEDRAAGSTNQVELTAQMATNQVVPIPPLAEQHRIVAKVDELMALCDQLEIAQTERETGRDKLTLSTFAKLNEPDPETFANDARFALEHLEPLTKRTDQITQLRQTILNLAVRGKLVEQDPNELPLSIDLVAKIDEAPCELPPSWQWVHFSDVASFENGDRSSKYPNRSEYVSAGVPWINTGHINPDGSLCAATMNYITEAKFRSLGGGKIRPGDLLYCLRGATFGKTAYVEPYEEGAIASSLMIIRPSPFLNKRYAYSYLTSPLGRQQLKRFDNGTAQPNLSSASVKRYLIPLPPLAEQHRIVAKVDELMALCDQLEASLVEGEQTRSKLLEAVLHEALEAA
ncbi:restriction endonuclease subunit S [Sandaracinobacteroides sp. A072]|uniref:restriction endonuclease subunit S n=1 Tax=Sandaracinobacteroides sp. A072 TaxID=3461146 RepID=UPI0040437D26